MSNKKQLTVIAKKPSNVSVVWSFQGMANENIHDYSPAQLQLNSAINSAKHRQFNQGDYNLDVKPIRKQSLINNLYSKEIDSKSPVPLASFDKLENMKSEKSFKSPQKVSRAKSNMRL